MQNNFIQNIAPLRRQREEVYNIPRNGSSLDLVGFEVETLILPKKLINIEERKSDILCDCKEKCHSKFM
jgi:hypothetical protein